MKCKWQLIPVLVLTAFTVLAGAVKDSGTHYAKDAVAPFINSGECPGAISILYNNGLQETACLGWADVESQTPMSLDRMFMQCSQTKGFCGVTIAQLIEDGKIALDDPVAKYLPAFKELKIAVKDDQGKTTLVPAKNVLTIRMVMNHTGGFPFEIPSKSRNGWTSRSLQDTAAEAAANPILFEPGTKMRYSNTGIDIGAAIVEVVTGQSWDAFLKERVLDPLEMTDTTFKPTEEQLKRAITIYRVAPQQTAQPHIYKSMPRPYNGPTVFPSAGAGLWTTAADQMKFYKMLMNLGIGDNGVRILKPETVKSLLLTSTRPAELGGYSLGLSVTSKGWVGHGGALGTNCTFDWKTRQLRLWVVQLFGSPRPGFTEWTKCTDRFFSHKIDDSGVNEYTGRVQ